MHRPWVHPELTFQPAAVPVVGGQRNTKLIRMPFIVASLGRVASRADLKDFLEMHARPFFRSRTAAFGPEHHKNNQHFNCTIPSIHSCTFCTELHAKVLRSQDIPFYDF